METRVHILVVDDNPYVRPACRRDLCKPQLAGSPGVADGQAMRQFLRTDRQRPILVILEFADAGGAELLAGAPFEGAGGTAR